MRVRGGRTGPGRPAVGRGGAAPSVALRTAQRLKALVNDEAIPHKSSEVAPYITVSQGVATLTPGGELQPAEMVQMADDALYRAKDSGRNTIIVAGSGSQAQEELSLNL